ncbi:DUF6160 family protein [Thalassolituus maritimus]|uniref:DUF6160 domain-containing protein n=1 Tax=Thalassolituus maritimus TaxID=484498 RepID=A0ABP9ZZB9_9GAMM
MKFLKKASLAASIAAVSFAANAELVAMDEMAMAAATGQAGIDLDITLTGEEAISIGEVLYTDTAGDATPGGGSLAISGIKLGSADGSAITLYNAIDIDETGSIIMDGSATSLTGLRLQVATVETRTSAGAAAANLVSGLDITMNVEGGVTTIAQSGADTTITSAGGSVEVTSGSMTLLNNAIGVSDLKVYGVDGEGSGISTDATLVFNGSGVSITDLDLAGTIEIGDLALGGSSIGSVSISNIALNGAAVTISGH